jgi:hypothetical protein
MRVMNMVFNMHSQIFRSILILCCIFYSGLLFGRNLSVEGTYQGKNIYIQNSLNDDGFGFCVEKVSVNGDIMAASINSDVFEIDFTDFNIAIGEPVFIVIEHNEGCTPKILNPEVLLPKSTYILKSISINKDGKLMWKTTGEQGKLTYYIEQWRWKKWVTVGEVMGKGIPELNAYEFLVTPHSGTNIIRLTQIDNSGKKRSTKEVAFKSTLLPVYKTPDKVKKYIYFKANNQSVKTRYEVFDAYGNIVKKGYDSVVNCENLLSGAYYINFDNKTEKFIKN